MDNSGWTWPFEVGGRSFVLHVAGVAQQARALAARRYAEVGYVASADDSMLTRYDGTSRVVVLLVLDELGREVGTLSVLGDGDGGILADSMYRRDLDALRRRGLRLVEFFRLAIDAPTRECGQRIASVLMTFGHAFGACALGGDTAVATVNPRHTRYYSRMLGFEQVGLERACARVQGAPAVLMTADFATQHVRLTGAAPGEAEAFAAAFVRELPIAV